MHTEKTIIINAATVKIAGGLVVTIDLIQLLNELTRYELIIISPSIKKFQKLPSTIEKIYTPDILLRPVLRWWLDFIWLPRMMRKYKPHLLITMGNLPARSRYPQLMLNDNAFVSQKNYAGIPLTRGERLKHAIRKKLFWSRMRYVNRLVVQTQTEKTRLESFGRKLPKIEVIPPLIPSHLRLDRESDILLPRRKKGTIRLLCLSYYWKHKNIKILTKVLQLASDSNYPLQLVFTLNDKRVKGGKKLVRQLTPFIDNEHAINVGNIPGARVKSLIEQCDGLILPSIIETFGLNSLEAWHCNKPFFVADKPFAREVCQNAAKYFDPFDADAIFLAIKEVFSKEEVREKLILNGTSLIKNWDSSKKYLALITNSLDE